MYVYNRLGMNPNLIEGQRDRTLLKENFELKEKSRQLREDNRHFVEQAWRHHDRVVALKQDKEAAVKELKQCR